MSDPSPVGVSKAERLLLPDIVRLVALFGIVIVNVEIMAFPGEFASEVTYFDAPWDAAFGFVVYTLALGKSYALFSFIFGVGFALQLRSAAASGAAFGPRYRNRMLGLILLGLCHAVLFFPGDILVTYGLLGGLIYWARNWSPKRLFGWAIALYVVQMIVLALILWGDAAAGLTSGEDRAWLDYTWKVHQTGSYWELVGWRAGELPYGIVSAVFWQGISTLSWFFLGLAAVKTDLLSQPEHRLWWIARRYFLLPALAVSAYSAWITVGLGDLWGLWGVYAAAPFLALSYLGHLRRVKSPVGQGAMALTRLGGASLTIYLGQSILLTTIFAPYGLDLWNAVGFATALLIALAATLVLLAVVWFWLRHFKRGPFEALLRAITGFGQRPAAPAS